MPTHANWPHAGALCWTLLNVFSLLHKIFSRKRAGGCQSYLGSELRENSGGYVVRGDQPRPTNSVPTVVARQPE